MRQNNTKIAKTETPIPITSTSVTPTLKEHNFSFRKIDPTKYNKFRANLVSKNLWTYYYFTMLTKANFNLLLTPSFIRSMMVEYMGFTHDHFDTNTIPALPKPQ